MLIAPAHCLWDRQTCKTEVIATCHLLRDCLQGNFFKSEAELDRQKRCQLYETLTF